MTIWNKYKKIKELVSNNPSIKTYRAIIETIIKEIKPKDINDYYTIKERLYIIKNEYNIYEIIEENDKLYIVIDKEKEKEIEKEIDKIIISDELNSKNEGIIEGHGEPIKKDEILKLFKMEKSMCKISFERINKDKLEKGKGTGFFCKLSDMPFKYALFTNNHILNESSIQKGKKINFEYYNEKKRIEITEERRVFTNEELDYTCIEVFKSDDINNYFEIEPELNKFNKKFIEINKPDIFILQYPNGNDISFSEGRMLSLRNNKIIHSASTNSGSSGSPIIRRCNDNYIIGLHRQGFKKKENYYKYNLATPFNLIIDDINNKNYFVNNNNMFINNDILFNNIFKKNNIQNSNNSFHNNISLNNNNIINNFNINIRNKAFNYNNIQNNNNEFNNDIIQKNSNEFNIINNNANEEEDYSYECLNKDSLKQVIEEGEEQVNFILTLKNNKKNKWPQGKAKIVSDCSSNFIGDDIILKPQDYNEIRNYSYVVKDLGSYPIGNYKIFLCFEVNEESYGDKLLLKVEIKEKQNLDIEDKIKEFRELYSLFKEDFPDEQIKKVIQKSNYNYERAFSSLFP